MHDNYHPVAPTAGAPGAPEYAHAVAQQGLRHHFADMEQQRASANLGMWVFLVTEIMFFGGLFCSYLVYRSAHLRAFEIGSNHMNFAIGTANTVILLTSSLFVALGVHAIQIGQRKLCATMLTIAALMGFAFLGLKGYEYYEHYKEGSVPGQYWHLDLTQDEQGDVNNVQMFFYIYFVMTGLHALHVTIGIGLLLTIAYFSWKGRYTSDYHSPVHVSGLYWHFVDLVWIFLYPLLYLISPTRL